MICLLGSPVAHSMSPAMHNEAFAELGLDYRYLAFDVKEGELAGVMDGRWACAASTSRCR